MLIEALGLARLDDSAVYEAFAAYMMPRWAESNWEVSDAEVHAWVATFLADDPACRDCSEHGSRATCVCAWRMNWR
jgi:hypothetical protein